MQMPFWMSAMQILRLWHYLALWTIAMPILKNAFPVESMWWPPVRRPFIHGQLPLPSPISWMPWPRKTDAPSWAPACRIFTGSTWSAVWQEAFTESTRSRELPATMWRITVWLWQRLMVWAWHRRNLKKRSLIPPL